MKIVSTTCKTLKMLYVNITIVYVKIYYALTFECFSARRTKSQLQSKISKWIQVWVDFFVFGHFRFKSGKILIQAPYGKHFYDSPISL